MRKMKESGIKWIGEIPRDWDVVPFYSYLDNANNSIVDGPFGSDMKNEEYVDDGVPVIQLGSIKEYQMDFSKMHYVTNEKADDLIRHNAKPGDIAIAKMMPAGKACEIPNDYPRYVVSADVIKASISNLYKRKYVIYALNVCATVQAEIEAQGSTRSRINISKAKRFMIPRPLNDDFKVISSFLDLKCSEIDSLTSDIQTQLDTLEQYKKSLITETVTKGLKNDVEMKDSGVQWIGTMPAHWKVIRLKNTAWLKGRIGWQGLRSDEFVDDPALPYLITGTDFQNGHIDWNTCAHISEERFEQDYAIHIKEDDLLITKDGTIGKVAVAIGCPEKVSLNSGVFIIRNTGKYQYYSRFMYYLFQSAEFKNWFTLSNAGNSTIMHLTQEKFYNFSFSFPPLDEQREIADYLDDKCTSIDTIIDDKKKQIDLIKDYKKSLIFEYVTGKKEVPDEF